MSLTANGPVAERRAMGVPGDATSVACIGAELYVCIRSHDFATPREGAIYRVPPDGSPAVLVLDLTHLGPLCLEVVAFGDRLVISGQDGLYELNPVTRDTATIYSGSVSCDGLAATDRCIVFTTPQNRIGFLKMETRSVQWLAGSHDMVLGRGDENTVVAWNRDAQRWNAMTEDGLVRGESTPVIDAMRRHNADDASVWCGSLWLLDRTESPLRTPWYGVKLRDVRVPQKVYPFTAYHNGPMVVWRPSGT